MMLTYLLIGITVLISYSALNNRELQNRWVHYPYREANTGEYYRMLSSGFLHGSYNHLFINMFVLFQFGASIEGYFNARFGQLTGGFLYIAFYITSIIFANIGTLLRHKDNPGFRSLGASGVTSAIVLIYCLFEPWAMFIFPPVPAILFAVLYIGYSQWAITGSRDNVDHQGHLWGSLYGLVFILLFDPSMYQYFWEQLKAVPFLQ